MNGREDYERAEREREFVERAQRGDALARAMYEAYTRSSGGLNWQGKPCPKWDELPVAICGHWQAAANAARVALNPRAPVAPLTCSCEPYNPPSTDAAPPHTSPTCPTHGAAKRAWLRAAMEQHSHADLLDLMGAFDALARPDAQPRSPHAARTPTEGWAMSDAWLERSEGPVHEHFGLTRANYLVLPRAVLQSMPIEWQRRLVGCIDDLHAAARAARVEIPDDYRVHVVDSDGRRIPDPIPHYRHAPDLLGHEPATQAPKDGAP